MPAIIPKQVLEDIRFRNDIAEVIGSYLTLQRAGVTFKALCPFHKEKTPSFHVNPQRQIYHCFGCGAGGDVFGFVMKFEGVDFMGAVKMLAQRAGVALELADEPGESSDKAALFRINSEVAALYREALLKRQSAAVARAYLEKRGLTAECIESFGIGYAPDRWDAVAEWARKGPHTPERVEAAGLLLKRNGPEGGWYDRFRNRLMFPIQDEQGRVVGFSGRALAADEKTAKYVNTPETPLFRKSRVLYALNKARRNIVEAREAILCEGQIDVIRCHMAGFTTAVAAQGTAFTEEHVHILRRYADSVVLVFDPDRAGQDAAVRTAGLLMESGLAVRVATLPKGEDPDLFIRQRGAEAFRDVLQAAQSAVAFQVAVLAGREDLRSEVGAMRAASAVLQTIGRSPNAVQRATLLQEASERLNVPLSALQEEQRRQVRRRSATAPREEEGGGEPPAPAPRPREETELCEHLAAASDQPQLADLVAHYLPLDMLSDGTARAFAGVALEAARTGKSLQEALQDAGADADTVSFAAAVQMAPAKIGGGEFTREDAVKDLILFIWRRRLERERKELEQRPEGQLSAKDEERRRQLVFDLRSLRSWENGAAVIEMELGE